jgi:hypothetical protein
MIMNTRRYLVLILCLIATSFVNAKEGFIQLDGTEINIQLQKELAPISKTFPEFFLSVSYEVKSSTLPLEFYAPVNDLLLFLNGKQTTLERIIGLSISKEFVAGEISHKDFSKFRKMLSTQINESKPGTKVLFDNTNSIGYRTIVKDSKQRVKAQSFALIKGKLLELEVSAVYKTEEDLRWANETLNEVVSILTNLNRK